MGHGFEAGAEERHVSMVQPILDCKALIAGGMGAGAYASIQGAGIEPIVTDMQLIDDAVAAYIAGTLKNHPEYLH
jgi:predicted Fe-Mo cluster-binding NifX family protein